MNAERFIEVSEQIPQTADAMPIPVPTTNAEINQEELDMLFAAGITAQKARIPWYLAVGYTLEASRRAKVVANLVLKNDADELDAPLPGLEVLAELSDEDLGKFGAYLEAVAQENVKIDRDSIEDELDVWADAFEQAE